MCGPPTAVDVVTVDETGVERQFPRLLLTMRGLGWGLNAADGSVEEARPWGSDDRPGDVSTFEEPATKHVGYSEDSKLYYLYIVNTRKMR